MRTLKDFEVKDKRVLVRCDFNVPLDKKGNILDDFRIEQTLPTIEYLIEKGAKLILMSHLDRPGGKVVESLRLTPIQNRLMEYLDVQVSKAPDCVGKEIEKRSREMQPGEILLLENLKFHKGEEENDENFAKELAKLGDVFINDAFGSCHQIYASIVGVPKYLPSGMGLLLAKEIKTLSDLLERPKKPLITIIGGKKVKNKSRVIDEISEKADWILINSLIKNKIEEKNIKLKYPQKIISPIDSIGTFDIGPKTIQLFKEKINTAKTIFWAGPLGMIEEEKFAKGSLAVAGAIIESDALTLVGGGDTIAFLAKYNLREKFDFVSTGGGSMLDFIVDGKLVGIEALK